MALRLHDTMTRRLREVIPLEDGHVRVYTCGPTVYARAHVGNFRTFLFEDVLRRWLERRFARVTHVMNLTDVEDKIIRNAVASGHDLDSETAPWIAAFFEDLDTLNIRRAHHYPRATEYIDEMVALIERLDAADVTYRSEDSVYFHISSFPQYGRLSGVRADGLVAGGGGRVDADEYDKDDARDFALWKAAGDEEIGWDTRIGRGRPGWHIECSAMSMALLGESFDIHCGGVDNIFPHHENEIAQSVAATRRPFVQIWCHGAHLNIEGEKMAKSLGNFATVRELVDGGARPSALRYQLIAAAHYRKPLNYDDTLHAATESVDRFADFSARVRAHTPRAGADGEPGAVDTRVSMARDAFAAAMDDDLNLPEAMGAIFTMIRSLNRELDGGALGGATHAQILTLIEEVDDVLGVLPLVERERAGAELTPDEQALLDAREAARAARQWAESDRLRASLAEAGIAVDDTAAGQRWHRF
ncbi:MAG: cysteine--tRNA ligase [Candidatus Dormibacteraeota bacterium]|uniref:Cysteine--tRNA ligase n=1 Tax=Candidatus Aeolococcus gillhamiae TaxID=3127015 RepID=A0A934MYK2_9BACT|nr:cysteine--tRNA ligase [Candidatus Dormibacteraeota bacterium]